jgi:hypothetical protein
VNGAIIIFYSDGLFVHVMMGMTFCIYMDDGNDTISKESRN